MRWENVCSVTFSLFARVIAGTRTYLIVDNVIFTKKIRIMINWTDYIDSDPDILVGKPKIIGTRLSVEFIMERLAQGWSESDILENYPSLSKESVQAVYAYTYEAIKDALLFPVQTKRA